MGQGKLIYTHQKIKLTPLNYRRDFAFWYLPQIQYKNPNVQISTLKNMTPSPFIRCFYGKETIQFH